MNIGYLASRSREPRRFRETQRANYRYRQLITFLVEILHTAFFLLPNILVLSTEPPEACSRNCIRIIGLSERVAAYIFQRRIQTLTNTTCFSLHVCGRWWDSEQRNCTRYTAPILHVIHPHKICLWFPPAVLLPTRHNEPN